MQDPLESLGERYEPTLAVKQRQQRCVQPAHLGSNNGIFFGACAPERTIPSLALVLITPNHLLVSFFTRFWTRSTEMPSTSSGTVLFSAILLMLLHDAHGSATPPILRGSINARTLETSEMVRNTTSHFRVQGWIEQPNYRGTFDILWTSLITIIISTYTMLCLNVPVQKDSNLRLVGRRLLWMFLGIIGPEFVLIYAAGQWSRAKWSAKAFKEEHPEWHMRHAFFADMGGFVLHTRDEIVFPVNAIQLRWLVRHKYVEFPKITRRELWDKSKQDTFTKVITAFQVDYMIIQCAARAAQRLTITTLELNVLAIVVCSLMTSYAWLHKPADVSTPTHIHTTKTVEDMIGNLEWDLTPLDHVDLNGPGYSVNVQPFMGMPVMPPTRPIQRIPNDRFLMDPYGAQ